MDGAGGILDQSGATRVRRMTVSDVADGHSILKESPEATIWSAESLLACARQDPCWVAERDGRVAGLLVGRAAADEFEILNLAVAKGCRRQGIATQLVRTALEYAQNHGAVQTRLEVRSSNASALALYAKMGFRATGRRANYYRDPAEDAVMLVLHKKANFH